MIFTKKTYDAAMARNQSRKNAVYRYAKNKSVPMHIRIFMLDECERFDRAIWAIFDRGLRNRKLKL